MPHFAPLVDPVVETLTLHENLNDNFAAFFFLNRSFHWGGEHLTKYSRDHIAYDHLFLALYRLEVADEFCVHRVEPPMAAGISTSCRNVGKLRPA